MNAQRNFTLIIQLCVAIVVPVGACEPSGSGLPCGDEFCRNGELCMITDTAASARPMCVTVNVCGNGILDLNEECDDANPSDTDGCLSNCKRNICGDGKISLDTEQCDDKNAVDGDGCDNNCSITACGNGVVTGSESCDDGNATDLDGCKSDCTANILAYIKASNTDGGDEFGFNVALSADGSTLAVGAYLEASAATGIGGDQTDNSAPFAGAVYVFTRSGTTWIQQAYIKASNTDGGDEFGYSIALSDDGSTLAVGATGEDGAVTGIDGDQADNSVKNAGAVYVFTRSGTTWTQQAYIKASNTDGGDEFGARIALSGDGSTLAVGAPVEGSAATGIDGDQVNNSAPLAGAVYMFTRNRTTWSQEAYIKASNTDAFDKFGVSVALSSDGSILAVGANLEDSAAVGIGDNQASDSAENAGAVYVFTRAGTTWSQQGYIKASNTDEGDNFGFNVALSGDGLTLAVGAPGEDSAAIGINGNQVDNSAESAGAVYMFTRSGTKWSQQAYIKASNTGANDMFGYHVALSADGSTLAVGVPLEDSAATGIGGNQADNSAGSAGAVYIFMRNGMMWNRQSYIKSSNTDATDEFGASVALSADGLTLAVGADGEDSPATGVNGDQGQNTAKDTGAVYVVY
jgi:cysteine-rich repeat protein